jgi:hypothetical protein
MASILPFPIRRGPWSAHELSSLANIRREFSEQGLETSAQHGVTDEGDAWAVICEGPTGSPMVHIARAYPTNILVWADGTSVRASNLAKFVEIVRRDFAHTFGRSSLQF